MGFKNGAQTVEPDLTANGNDATRQGTWGPSLTAEQGSYTLSGQAATLLHHRRLVAAQGAYVLSGQDATLTNNPAAGDPPTINGSESLIVFTNFQNPRIIDSSGQTWTAGDYVLALFASTATLASTGLPTAANGGTDDTSTSIIANDDNDAALASFEVTVNGGALDSSFSFPTPDARRNGGGLITFSGAAANASQPNVSGQTSGTSNDPTAPGVTTTVDNCLVIGAISVRGAQDLTTLLGALPSGWTFLFSGRTSASTTLTAAHCTFAVCHKVQAIAGPTGDAVWTDGVDVGSIAGWNGQQIAIAPA